MSVEVVAMIYKSTAFAAFIREELADCGSPVRIVGNDPTTAVARMCDAFYHDPRPEDWYLSRVYRCWNWCVQSSEAEHVCLVNSDMAFSPGWLKALTRRLDGRTLPTSRLVECGNRLQAGENAIQVNLGDRPSNFEREQWDALASSASCPDTLPGGCYMPCLLNRKAFLEIGGYPEGNVADGKVVNRVPTACDHSYLSGDYVLFQGMAALGYRHVTACDSLVYHMQEGEMRA